MKELTTEIIEFIRQHEGEDPGRLLLAAGRYPDVDVPFAVEQLMARRQIRDKLPSWHARRELVYPSRLAAEQCSSEATATYKQGLATGNTLCDLTGGLGVDTYFFSRTVPRVYYAERWPDYREAARRNFATLGAKNIEVVEGDAAEVAERLTVDTFYLDPARRGEGNKRVFALTDCEPDVLALKPLLLRHAHQVIVKISPMADIAETLRLLPETVEVHAVAVRNECKELLFVLENDRTGQEPTIHAVNLPARGAVQCFSFLPSDEANAHPLFAEHVGTYLYEPHSALLKSGAFKLVSTRLGVQKLHASSHLYTADTPLPDFPGRRFRVEAVHDFSGKQLRQLGRSLRQANLTTRNFPLTVAQLRQKSGLAEGGDCYLFATTCTPDRLVLIQTRKAE